MKAVPKDHACGRPRIWPIWILALIPKYFLLLFPKHSTYLRILVKLLLEVGEKRRLNGTSKVHGRRDGRRDGGTDGQTDKRTDTQTDISTYRKNWSEGQFFENINYYKLFVRPGKTLDLDSFHFIAQPIPLLFLLSIKLFFYHDFNRGCSTNSLVIISLIQLVILFLPVFKTS